LVADEVSVLATSRRATRFLLVNPSIRTLALKAGVSNATVSLALRNAPRISPAVREKIQMLAREEGYKPNQAVSRMFSHFRKNGRHAYVGTLAFVHTSPNPSDRCVETVRAWVESAKARAAELGYQVDEFSLGGDFHDPRRLAGVLKARGIQAVFLAGPFRSHAIPPELSAVWRGLPCVVVGERPASPALACVMNDQFATARRGMNEILQRGYSRPALCLNPDLDSVLEGRFRAGYMLACERFRHRIPVFDFVPGEKKRFLQWVRKWRPDAILTLHHEIRDWCLSAGLGEMGLVHLDRHPALSGWAGMEQDNEHVGSAAAELLLGQLHFNIRGEPAFQQCIQLGSTWRNGRTIRPRTGHKVNC